MDYLSILDRMKIAAKCKSENQLSIAMKLSSNTVITAWKKRKNIPLKRIEQVSITYDVNLEWLLTGNGPMHTNSPLDNPQIASLIELARLSSLNNYSPPFEYLSTSINLIQEIVFTKYIIHTLNSFYSIDPDENDIPYILNGDFFRRIFKQESFHDHVIDFIFKSIKQSSIEYFSNTASFYLLLEAQTDSIDILVEEIGYDKSNPIINKKMTEKALLELLKDNIRFENNTVLLFLKNNIIAIEKLWYKWKKYQKIRKNNDEVDILNIEYEMYCYQQTEDDDEFQAIDSFEAWFKSKNEPAHYITESENGELEYVDIKIPSMIAYYSYKDDELGWIENYDDPRDSDTFFIITDASYETFKKMTFNVEELKT